MINCKYNCKIVNKDFKLYRLIMINWINKLINYLMKTKF